MREISRCRIPRARHQIHFRESWCRYVPAIRLCRDVVLQQISRFSLPVDRSTSRSLAGDPSVARSSAKAVSRSLAAPDSVCESKASTMAAALSAASTRGSRLPPIPPEIEKQLLRMSARQMDRLPFLGCSSLLAHVAVRSSTFPAAVHSVKRMAYFRL